MLEQRRRLPAWQEKENILGQLDRCQVLVVSGMTGWVTQGSFKMLAFKGEAVLFSLCEGKIKQTFQPQSDLFCQSVYGKYKVVNTFILLHFE